MKTITFITAFTAFTDLQVCKPDAYLNINIRITVAIALIALRDANQGSKNPDVPIKEARLVDPIGFHNREMNWLAIVVYMITIRHIKGFPNVLIKFTGNKNSVSLSCNISPFLYHASWRRGETKSLTECTRTFCTRKKHGSYIFNSTPKGIIVTISPFGESEIGKVWTCTSSTGSAKYKITQELYSALPSVSSSGQQGAVWLGKPLCNQIPSMLVFSITIMLLI